MSEVLDDLMRTVKEGTWIEVLFGFRQPQEEYVRDRGLVVHVFKDESNIDVLVVVFEKIGMIYGSLTLDSVEEDASVPAIAINPGNWDDWPEHSDLLVMLQLQHQSHLNVDWEGGLYTVAAIDGKEIEYGRSDD